ncbi:MAG: zinc ribbon domain-containing protein, partial [Victivallaceae bacterium]
WNKGGIGTYLMYGGIIVIGIIILIIIVVILRRNKAKRQLQYQNNNGSDNKVINTEQRAKEIAEREKEAIINEANRKLALERKTAEERQREIDSIKYESEQKIAAEKKTAEEKQREIDSLKKQEPKQIIYHVHGDLHSENIGILAKDDAIVNHGKVSTGDNKDNSPKLFDEKEVNIRKCNNCGAEIKNTEALFCDKCGKKLR